MVDTLPDHPGVRGRGGPGDAAEEPVAVPGAQESGAAPAAGDRHHLRHVQPAPPPPPHRPRRLQGQRRPRRRSNPHP